MDKVTLGRSGLKVSPICFGTWELGGEWGAVDHSTATTAIHRAREVGINFFDTAQGYGFGELKLMCQVVRGQPGVGASVQAGMGTVFAQGLHRGQVEWWVHADLL